MKPFREKYDEFKKSRELESVAERALAGLFWEIESKFDIELTTGEKFWMRYMYKNSNLQGNRAVEVKMAYFSSYGFGVDEVYMRRKDPNFAEKFRLARDECLLI